jgi:phytoene/squalene synthetase
MELDLNNRAYDRSGYEEYIYGSAEVVGLMCLSVFCEGNKAEYEKLRPSAKSLGAAFQKVNFLRDLKADFEGLDRVYFPDCDFSNFTAKDKLMIEADIQKDFDDAYAGIIQLPLKARFGLFKKIKKIAPQQILEERIRIPDYGKAYILAKAGIRSQLNIL